MNPDSDNHLGSSSFLTDAAGDPYQFVLYLPFGETFAEDRAAGYATPYRFNAKELDEETGLYYYGARYYDPRVSMWWGVDPMAGKFPHESPYLYTSNNPIRYIDPTGMEKEDWYLPTGGAELVFDKDVRSQADIDNSGGRVSGTYVGSSAYRVTDDGNTVSYNSNGTKSDAIGLTEASVVGNYSGPSIRPSESNRWEQFGNANFATRLAYGILNDAWLTTQRFNPFDMHTTHLSGDYASQSEYTLALMNTVATAVPIGRTASAVKAVTNSGITLAPRLNAAQFSKSFKGTMIARTHAQNRGKLNRLYNFGVDQINTRVGTGNILFLGTKIVGNAENNRK